MKETLKQTQPLVFIETYGCQMNKCDSEIVQGILHENGFKTAATPDEADLILVNTCSVRDHAEKRALGRISTLSSWKKAKKGRKLGVIGCMAQRLGRKLQDMKPFIDIVAGPDAYNNIPDLLKETDSSCYAELDHKELYTKVHPHRNTSFQAWITIIRGCNNFCSYCIVPYTRGRERSRQPELIIQEVAELITKGFQEFTLLGQNVNSYTSPSLTFAGLLDKTANLPGVSRMRFMTSHPKDFSDELIDVIASNPNICKHIHLPLQAGSDNVLQLMNRKYTRDEYLQLVDKIRNKIPGVSLTTDILVGFPGETDINFQDTFNLVETIRFDDAFTYQFSPRSGTPAFTMDGQVEEKRKLERLGRLIKLQRKISLEISTNMIGQTVEVVPEITSKHSEKEWLGKTGTNHVVIFPKQDSRPGDKVKIEITTCLGSTLRGTPV